MPGLIFIVDMVIIPRTPVLGDGFDLVRILQFWDASSDETCILQSGVHLTTAGLARRGHGQAQLGREALR